MHNLFLATLPELLLTIMGCVVMVVGLSKTESVRRLCAPLSLVGLFLAGFIVSAEPEWFAHATLVPSGILAGHLAGYISLITILIATLTILISWNSPKLDLAGDFFAMILFSTTGVMLTALSADLVTLFFALELTSIPTYVLVTLSREKDEAHEAGTKYFFLGALAAAITVYGFSLLYGATGTTKLHEMVAIVPQILGNDPAYAGRYWTLMLGLLFSIAGLSFKIAAVPFHVYAPDVYTGAHVAVTGFLGYIPKTAGFVAMILILAPMRTGEAHILPGAISTLLAVLAIITMTWGNVIALLQENVKRMLAYSSIAHSGYLLIGVVVGPALSTDSGMMADGQGAVLFYLAGYGVMNLGVFAVLGYLQRRDETAETLDDLAGLYTRSPLAAFTLLVCAFSLMGMPPLIGFWGKVAIFGSAWTANNRVPLTTTLVIVGMVNSAIAAAYYLRLVTTAFLREPLQPMQHRNSSAQRLSLIGCSVLVILFGVFPAALYRYAASASPVGQALQDAAAHLADHNRRLQAADAPNVAVDTHAEAPTVATASNGNPN